MSKTAQVKYENLFNSTLVLDISNGIVLEPKLLSKRDMESQISILKFFRKKADERNVTLYVAHPDGTNTEVPEGVVSVSPDGYNFSIKRPPRSGMSYWVESQILKAEKNGYHITVIEE